MIDIKNLCFSYSKNTPLLLDNITLNIPKGVYLSIVGENGSCKTTLVKLILGLLKPLSGTISIDTNNIAYVPQRVDNFNSQFPISVFEVLKVHAKTINIKGDLPIINALKEVNMLEFKNSLIGDLSGGQQQRVFIARALLGSADLIILDEPSTGVDYKNQCEIYSLLKKLNREQGTTIISIEHNMEFALNYSTHILQIKEGHLKLFNNEEYKEYVNSLKINLNNENKER